MEESHSHKPTEFSKKDKVLNDSTRNASDAHANVKKGPVQHIRDSIQRYKSYFKNRSAFSPHSIQTQADNHNQASSLRANQNPLYGKYQYKKSPSPQKQADFDNIASYKKIIKKHKQFQLLSEKQGFERYQTGSRKVDGDQMMSNSVSYQGKTSAGDGQNNQISQRKLSESLSALQSWQVISSSKKDQIPVMKSITK